MSINCFLRSIGLPAGIDWNAGLYSERGRVCALAGRPEKLFSHLSNAQHINAPSTLSLASLKSIICKLFKSAAGEREREKEIPRGKPQLVCLKILKVTEYTNELSIQIERTLPFGLYIFTDVYIYIEKGRCAELGR